MKGLMTFIGGALVGAAIAALYTPVKGEDLRERIRRKLIEKGLIEAKEVEQFVDVVIQQLEQE